MSIQLMDPGGAGTGSAREFAPRLDHLAGKKIGLLTNGKHNADILLKETAALFEREFDCEVVHFVDKRDAGKPANPEFLQALFAKADFLITAVGD